MAIFTPDVTITNTPLAVDTTGQTIAVTGTVTANAGTGPFPVSDNGGSLTVDGTVAVSNFPGASSGVATVTAFNIGTSATTISASNAAKTRVIVFNEQGTLYVKLGTGASASSYTYRLSANASLEFEGYYGDVTAIKASGTTQVLVTEVGI